MGWVKVDDNMPDHPKIIRAGARSLELQIRALCYCSRHLTKGIVPTGKIAGLTRGLGSRTAARWTRVMIEAGLWERSPGRAIVVHDYLLYNQQKQDLLAMTPYEAEGPSPWIQGLQTTPPMKRKVRVPGFKAYRPHSPKRLVSQAIPEAKNERLLSQLVQTTPPIPPTPPLIVSPPDLLGERVVVVGAPQTYRSLATSTTPAPPLKRPEPQPQSPPEYVLSCDTCASMLRELNHLSARSYTAPGRAGEFMHQAHHGRTRDAVLEVIRRQVRKLLAHPGKSRFLSPSVLFKPENWDTSVNESDTLILDRLPDWRDALKGEA